MLNLRSFILLVVVVCILNACQQGTAANSGAVAPAISGNDIAGEYFNLGQQRGKVVVLFFWSRKCCGDSLKKLEPLSAKYRSRGLAMVGVEVGSAKDQVAVFLKDNALDFTNLSDDYSMISRAYRVVGFPTIFLIDRAGVIQRKISGEISAEQLDGIIAQILLV